MGGRGRSMRELAGYDNYAPKFRIFPCIRSAGLEECCRHRFCGLFMVRKARLKSTLGLSRCPKRLGKDLMHE